MAQLTCTNLTLRYGENVLVRGLSFEVNAGDYLCIVGENGSGKSTLVRTLLHLQAPAEGKIPRHAYRQSRCQYRRGL